MTNYLKELHPFSIGCYLFFLLFLILTADYNQDMVILFFAFSLFVFYHDGIATYGKMMGSFMLMILGFALFEVIFYHQGEHPFLYINGIPLTMEALFYGVAMGCMVAALFLWFRIFNRIFDSRKITWMLGSRFPVTGLILSMVFCYYDKFRHKLDKIQEVWESYGTEKKFGTFKHSGIVLSVLLSVMLEDSVDTAMSMNVRAYGKGKRTSYVHYTWQLADVFFVLCTIFAIVRYLIVPPQQHRTVMFFLVIVPILYNIYKELQWKYYLWKI